MKKYLLVLIIIVSSFGLRAQSLPVGTPVLEDYYRRGQLLGLVDSSNSFCARPFFPIQALGIKNVFDPENSLEKNSFSKSNGILKFGKGKGIVKLLPYIWINQFNTDRPAGLNDGAMIPARGYQTFYSRGIYAKYGHLSIQLMPEFVHAENLSFAGFPDNRTDPDWAEQLWYQIYHYAYNKIDMPERFGDKAFDKIYWGQSSIRLNYGALSFGLSNENLWWGPGIYNSLLMTNCAPGFKHLTLNTVKPIRTLIGSFEGQIIAGKLEQSGYTPPEPDRRYFQTLLYVPKPDDWRYLSGIVLTYQPKWVPGLFVGLARSYQVYSKVMGKSFGDYFPIFNPFGKKGNGGTAEDAKKRTQLGSVFARWIWQKAKGEIYFEYGRSDYFWNLQDLELEASHSSAYILGLRKLIPLKAYKGEYIQVNMEVTQLEMNPTTRQRNGQSWYISDVVSAGYTNKGQLLGAGIGPGSNLQTINISWIKSLKTIGIKLERYVHNNDFFNTYITDPRMNWVDISAGLNASWYYKNLLFSFNIDAIRSINYQWLYIPIPSNPPQYWDHGKDLYNYHAQIGVTYRF